MRADTQKEVSRRINSDRMDEKSCVDLVESVNSIVLRWNADFIITYMNHYGERFLGYNRDELVGRSVIGTIVPETSGEGEDMTELMRSIFRHPERYVNNENENLRKDGSRVWVSWTNHAVIGSDGRIVEIMSIGNDITDRKRMEKELRRARDDLEARVRERTQELTISNQSLREEIGDRQKTEAALLESETRFREMVDLSPVPTAIYDTNEKNVLVNEKFVRTFGYTAEDIPSLNDWWPRAYPDRAYRQKVIDQWSKHVEKALKGSKEIEPMEAKVTCKDGSVRYVDFAGASIGNLIMVTMLDITERKQAEDALRDSEERFRATFEQAAVGIAHVLPDGRIVRANEKFCEITGYPHDEIINRTFQSITDPEDLATDLDLIERLLAGKIDTYTIEKRYIRKDRSRTWVNVTVSLVRDAEGSPKYFIGIVKDITDQKQVEHALQESKARLQSIFRAAPTGIGLVTNRRITEANSRLCEMVGYTRDELAGRSARMLYQTQEDYDFVGREKYRQISETGTGTVETRWRRKDGHIIDILLSSTPLDPDNLSAGVTFTALDITERKRAEKALKESEERLRLKLDSVLSPDVDLSEQELSNVIDTQALQRLMDDFYAVTGIGIGILDLKGTVLVGTGWQKACTHFHRQCPQSLKNCIESDLQLSMGVKKGEFRAYKCKNNMWDIVTPMYIGEKQVGNIFLGQFFYDDEVPDMSVFAAQAERFGFDKDTYLAAVDSVPRWSREMVGSLMRFYARLADMISSLSFSNLKLARAMSEEKRAEEAIRRLTRRDEEALRVAHMGHWEYDIATGMFIFNDQYYTLHGITAREAGGYLMSAEEFALKYMDPEYAHIVRESIEAAQKTTDPNYVFRTESRILRSDGQPRDVIVWFRTEKDNEGRTVRLYGVNQDITERKRAEMALEHAKAQAELYVDLMGHDISNMNQAMMGYLELAELTIPMEPEQRELIEKPIEIINHSARMIDNVRKLERIHQGRYVEKVIDMCTIISSVAEEFSRVKDRSVTINRSMPDTCQVIADDVLRDVFSNIVENAIRHTTGPVTIDIAVELLEAGGRRYYRTSISDNGPGIPDEQKRRVFTFMQGYTAKPGRRGLGLCLVKTLVEHFRGQVWVENRVPGNYRQGAKFVVELPAA